MIVNEPAIDYIRLTSFDFERYEKGVTILRGVEGAEWQRGGLLQYKGNKFDSIFFGQGEQNQRTHYMIDISGGRADDMGFKLLTTGMKTTRIDLQLTLELPPHWDIREFTDAMRNGVWPNRVRKVTAIDGNGDDTLYIGSRTSGKYIRFYVKDGEWLRYEMEIKGDEALIAAGLIRNGGKSAIAGILLSEIEKLPDYPMLDYFKGELLKVGNHSDIKVTRVEPDKIRRLKWLASLIPTIERMMNDHDYGHTVFSWLDHLCSQYMERQKGG